MQQVRALRKHSAGKVQGNEEGRKRQGKFKNDKAKETDKKG